jgi:hypothetical protein
MYKYRSKCRWNMLLHIDEEVVEIRPSELFESKSLVSSRYLELLKEPKERKLKGKEKLPNPPKKEEPTNARTSSP